MLGWVYDILTLDLSSGLDVAAKGENVLSFIRDDKNFCICSLQTLLMRARNMEYLEGTLPSPVQQQILEISKVESNEWYNCFSHSYVCCLALL